MTDEAVWRPNRSEFDLHHRISDVQPGCIGVAGDSEAFYGFTEVNEDPGSADSFTYERVPLRLEIFLGKMYPLSF